MRFSLFTIIAFAIIAAGAVLRAVPFAPPLATPAAVALSTSSVFAEEKHAIGPQIKNSIPFPVITAKSAAVVDGETGALLGEKDKDRVTPIASLTKLMTALVFLDTSPAWQEEITMENTDNRPGGTLFVRAGERLTFYDLFMTMLVGSANNAAVALTRASGGSIPEFVERMNARAERMGLSATHFVEPTGLDEGNVSTALDLVRLAWHAFATPSLRDAVTAKEYVFATLNTGMRHRVKTTNELLLSATDGYTLIGAKTGYTHEAGYTFLVEAERNGHRVIVAVLGAPQEEDRFRDADTLIRWAFQKYVWE